MEVDKWGPPRFWGKGYMEFFFSCSEWDALVESHQGSCCLVEKLNVCLKWVESGALQCFLYVWNWCFDIFCYKSVSYTPFSRKTQLINFNEKITIDYWLLIKNQSPKTNKTTNFKWSCWDSNTPPFNTTRQHWRKIEIQFETHGRLRRIKNEFWRHRFWDMSKSSGILSLGF